MNKKRHVAVVAGGDSSEYGISMKSADIVMKNLQDAHHVYLIEMIGNEWNYLHNNTKTPIDKNNFSLALNNTLIKFDVVFIAIHGTPGEDGKLQGYLDMQKIKYTSAGVLPLALTFNKGYCNSYLAQQGVKCARSIQLYEGIAFNKEIIIEQLGLPCFVKPNQAGSSYGVSKVNHVSEFDSAVEEAFKHDSQVLVESFLDGREITVGVHNFNGELTALPPTEIITENDFFDFEAKYEGKSQEITPAEISETLTLLVQNAAKEIFLLAGLTGVARVDFIIHDNAPYMIEVNTVPGLSAESLIPQQAVAAGYTLPQFFSDWIAHALR